MNSSESSAQMVIGHSVMFFALLMVLALMLSLLP